jgi:hypothetical protein
LDLGLKAITIFCVAIFAVMGCHRSDVEVSADEKTGNRYFQIIDHRCAKTKIGQADTAKHWFVDQTGQWSTAEEEAYRAMHKELEPKRSSE